MENQRRSHSLQPINRAPIADPQFDESPSLVSTNNLAQVLLLQRADQRSSDSSSSSSSSPAPSFERSPPISRRTTSRPNCPPPPPPRPPPYTSAIFDRIQIPSNLLNEASEIHQDIEVKLTRIQLCLLRQEFERQDEINNCTNLH